MLALANAFAAAGHPTHLVVQEEGGPLEAVVSPGVELTYLNSGFRRGVPRLALLLRRWGVRGVLLAHDRRCVPPAVAALLAGVPYVPTIHGLTGPDYPWGRGSPLRRRAFRLLATAVFRRARAVVAVSESAARSLRQSLALPAGAVVVPPQPVVFPELERAAEAPVDHPWFTQPDRPVIVTVCRLAPVKDLPNLVAAFALLRRVRLARLVIVGDGPEAPALRRAIAEAGVGEDVLLTGFDLNPWRWVARSDVLAVSSLSEGMGCALIEAAFLGLPVVSTDCGGPRDVLESGRWGELVPPRNPALLAEAIARALDGGTAERSARRAAMAQRYSLPAAFQAYRDILLGPQAR